MRHRYVPTLIVVLSLVIIAGIALFAATTRHEPTVVVGAPTDEILAIDADPETGATVFTEDARTASCAECHALDAADSVADLGPALDVVAPDREQVIDSIVSGEVGEHEDEELRIELGPRQIADVAAYVAQATD